VCATSAKEDIIQRSVRGKWKSLQVRDADHRVEGVTKTASANSLASAGQGLVLMKTRVRVKGTNGHENGSLIIRRWESKELYIKTSLAQELRVSKG
jgi:hypothetical protein